MTEEEQQFKDVTGCRDDATAKFFLESAGNDVQQAIDMFLEGGALPFGQATASAPGVDHPENPSASISFGVADANVNGDNEEQRWYTGGPAGGSGQEVIAPGDNRDGKKNKAFEDVRQAVEPHLRAGTYEDLEEESSIFTGAARTLDGQVRHAPRKKKKMVIKFFPNGVFTVDDGPPRRVEDPKNQNFLKAIKDRRVPDEFIGPDFHDGLDLSIMSMEEDYDFSTAPRPVFTGKANKLGDGGSAGPSTSTAASEPIPVWNGPREGSPVTSIQIRLPDGSRLVGRFNHDQQVRDIRAFVAAARPGKQVPAVIMSGFPSKPITDESKTIAESDLVGSVVIFK